MLWPTSSRMSFHSEHATWQALQPIQVEVSISLAISMVLRACGLAVGLAERRLMSRDCNAMVRGSLGFFQVHKEGFVFGGLRIAVTHRRRQAVGEVAFLRHAFPAPVQRNADLVDGP